MVSAAVCQPLAARPRRIERFAASSLRWNGCGSNSAAKDFIRAASIPRRTEFEFLAHDVILEIVLGHCFVQVLV